MGPGKELALDWLLASLETLPLSQSAARTVEDTPYLYLNVEGRTLLVEGSRL